MIDPRLFAEGGILALAAIAVMRFVVLDFNTLVERTREKASLIRR